MRADAFPTREHGESNRAAFTARALRVALIGNPNTGKTSLFNALTGFNRHVANYPGVTVELARGPIRGTRVPMELFDLPGTYSLAAASPDEAIVTDTLCARPGAPDVPDVLLVILDASNLSRNLYLLSQLVEFGLPIVVALNMVDIAESRGLAIDAQRLSSRLGVPVVPVVATRPATVRNLVTALDEAPQQTPTTARVELPPALVDAAQRFVTEQACATHPCEAVRALLYPNGHAEQRYLQCGGSAERLAAAREALREQGVDSPVLEVQARYAWIARILDGVVTRPASPVRTWSDRVDELLTHKVTGLVALIAVLYAVFWALFAGAAPLMDTIDTTFAWVAGGVQAVIGEGVWGSLLADGIVAGVGGVLIFLPQILILFAFIAILEDCGYLARAAYLMDRLMRGIGLSGRAFIPLLSSFACAVPAIMGTRAIADRRERLLTIMLAPFMSCPARLPVYAIFIAAFVPPTALLGGWLGLQPLVMLGMYAVGVVTAIPVAWLLRKTMIGTPTAGFVLELPSYKLPRLRAVWQRMWTGGKSFVVRAGTIILIVNLCVWALGYFPHSDATLTQVQQEAAAADWSSEQFDAALQTAYLEDSYLSRLGHFVQPAVATLGWDWRVSVGVLASFPAREVIVATMGTLFNMGGDDQAGLINALRNAKHAGTGEPLFNLPVALSIMVFFALCAQCGATLAVMKKETGSWAYPVTSFFLMTGLAYVGAWITVVIAGALVG